MVARKWLCEECHEVSDRMLEAPNPFDEDDIIYGCPSCRCVGEMFVACDEPGCKRSVSCGTPTADGYRSTCSKHKPEPLVTCGDVDAD